MGLLGGASALAILGVQPAAAAPAPDDGSLQPARSYAELLDPIPNAANVLRAEDQRAAQESQEKPMELAQLYFEVGPPGYYHHDHHHHHHHHRGYYGYYGYPHRHYHHHHHHHHHYHNYYGYY